MTGADCMGAVALLYDRTAEQQLREKEERLERATFWTELAASMSHEVRNPLVAIKTFAQLLPERYEDPEFRSSFSELVAKEVDRLNKIIQQIDDFANPPQLQFKAIDVKDTLRKGLDMAVLRIPQNGVSIQAKAADDLPKIRGDERALAECFSEIITNAMEASQGRKKPRIEIATEEGETVNGQATPGVTIIVKDNAGGIPEEIRDKVFSPFCTTKARGMGLGLPIARRTVTDHSGRLEINSGKKGTAVRITLPAVVGNGPGQDEAPAHS
jgi:two-component system sensor histidine kinase AtoS